MQVTEILQPLDDIDCAVGLCEWSEVANARDEIRRRLEAALSAAEPVSSRNDEAGYVEFLNQDVPYIVRDIHGYVAILMELESRNVIGYRVYDPDSVYARRMFTPASSAERLAYTVLSSINAHSTEHLRIATSHVEKLFRSAAPRKAGGRQMRDIYEVANQLGGFVDPSTDKFLAKFLLREAEEAAALANEIVRLRQLISEANKSEVEARAKALEEAANVADQYAFDAHALSQATRTGRALHDRVVEIADAIRERKDKEPA